MPMGTDPIDIDTEPQDSESQDPRDARIKTLEAQLQSQGMASQSTPMVQPWMPTDPRDAQIKALQAQLGAQSAQSTPSESTNKTADDPRDAQIAELRAMLLKVTAPPVDDADVDKTAPDWIEKNFTHYIHLADGQVKKVAGFVTRWHETDSPKDSGIGVVGVYPR